MTRIVYVAAAIITLLTVGVWIANVRTILESGSVIKRVVVPILTVGLGFLLFVHRRQLVDGTRLPGDANPLLMLSSAVLSLLILLVDQGE